MTSVLHATAPYGRYLRSYCTDEVIQRDDRFVVFHVRYRDDAGAKTEIERSIDAAHPQGHGDLATAIQAAEDFRKGFLECEAEERAGAAEDVRVQEYAYEAQQPCDPDDLDVAPPCDVAACNTRIEYLYRDDGNYKQYDSIVVAGLLTEREQQELHESLSGGCFIPEQVGMRPLQAGLQQAGPGEDDVWHEIDTISSTNESATFAGSAQELLAKFKSTRWDLAVSALVSSNVTDGPGSPR